MEFVKGKPKGTNPAIMGNSIDMYAVNGNKKQSSLITEHNKAIYNNTYMYICEIQYHCIARWPLSRVNRSLGSHGRCITYRH